MGKKIWISAVAFSLLLTVSLVLAPTLPTIIYGNILLSGSDAPSGTEIVSRIDSADKGSLNTTYSGQYGMNDTDPKLVVSVDNPYDQGKAISFYVKTQNMSGYVQALEAGIYNSSVYRIDITTPVDSGPPVNNSPVKPQSQTYDNTSATVDISDVSGCSDSGAVQYGMHAVSPYRISYSDAGTSYDSNCSDNSYSVASPFSQSANASFPGTDSHYYCIRFECRDALGNTAAFYSAGNILYDITAPDTTLSIGSPRYGAFVRSSTSYTLSAADNSSGVISTQYKVDSGAWTAYSTPFTISSPASHTIYYKSTDNAGNTESEKSSSVYVDDLPPATTDDAPAGWQQGSILVTLSPSDGPGSGVAYTSYRLDSLSWANGTVISVDGDGNHTILYYSADNLGNIESTKTAYVAIDETAPESSLNSTNSTTAGTFISHNLYWTDNIGLSGYIFSFDNGTGTFVNDSVVSFSGTSNWSNATKYVNSTIGSTIRWIVYANDTADNWNVSSTYSYTSRVNCGTLSTANTIYTLTENIASSGTCLTIGADNITINGNGYTINYAQSESGYAIDNTGGYDNITIKNLNIIQGSTISDSYAIYCSGMSNSVIKDSNITTSSLVNGNGIMLEASSESNNITNNKISILGNAGTAIYISQSKSNNIFNNIISGTGSNGYGLYIDTSNQTNISNNNISSSKYGIQLYQSSLNDILDNKITASSSDGFGIYIQSSALNNITGGSISNQNYDYSLQDAGETNNFTNTNFTSQRSIFFWDAISWFNYNNQSNGNIWLKTSVDQQTDIKRTLINWSNTSMIWNDTASMDLIATYNLTGLLISTDYAVENGSTSQTVTTDSTGELNVQIALANGVQTTMSVTQITNTAPSITLSSPVDASWSKSKTVAFNFIPSDDAGYTNCSIWSNNTGSWAQMQANTSAISNDSVNTISATFTNDGVYLWGGQCFDNGSPALSNFSANNRTIKIDTTSPIISISLPANTTYNSASRTLNYSITETNLNTTWYQYNGINTTITGNVSFTALDNQQSTLILWANDSAGNINSTTIIFTVDTIHNIKINSIAAPASSPSGVTINVTGNISNTGGFNETVIIRLKANGVEVANRSVNISSKETRIESLGWTPQSDGIYTLTLLSDPISGESNTSDNNASTSILISTTHDMSVDSISYNKSGTTVYLYDSINVSANVTNRGNVNETATVALKEGTSTLSTQSVTLTPGQSKEISFLWSPATSGYRTISVESLGVTGESDFTDNARSVPNIKVWSVVESMQLSWANSNDYPRTSSNYSVGNNFYVWGKPKNLAQTDTTFYNVPLRIGTSNLPIVFVSTGGTSNTYIFNITGGSILTSQYWQLNANASGAYNITLTLGNPGDSLAISRLVQVSGEL